METLNAYIKQVNSELSKAKVERASIERKIQRLETILGNAEFYFQKEQKKGSVRFRKSMGEKVTLTNKTSFKKKEASNVPEKESVAVAPAVPEVAPGKEKKSSWSLFS